MSVVEMALSTVEGVPNLYVGGLWALRRSQSLLDRKITHVLSLVSFNPANLKNFKDEPFSEYGKPFKHLLIDIDDVEDSDLLIELPQAVKFIDEGLRSVRPPRKANPSSSDIASVEKAVENITLDSDKDLASSAAAASASASASTSASDPPPPPKSHPRHGAVFVHCAAGKSRSISVIIAYLLWRHPERFTGSAGSELASSLVRELDESVSEPVRAALALVKKTRPLADPNSGFMMQLHHWWQMGCPADDGVEAQPIYQRWLYQRAAKESLAVGQAPSQLFFEDEAAAQSSSSSADAAASSSSSSSATSADRKLRCKKCRRILATGPFIVPHQPRAFNDDDLEDAKARGLPPPTRPPCQHFFIEPLSWMRGELEKGELGGRLSCPNPKCGAGVGRYDWKGFPCSCGGREDPAFSLQKARVDEEVSRAVLRMPPGARGGNGNL
ncbi:hypothetical protein ACHAQJ_006358 [Trichoderma viride]